MFRVRPIKFFDESQKQEHRGGASDSLLGCCNNSSMKALLDQVVAYRTGALLLLLVAAFLEAYGDSCFQAGLYRSSGVSRFLAFLLGGASLVSYGLVVNAPRWEFGKLLGVYVVLFFLCAQVIARVRFGQVPSTPVIVGGAMIVAGGLIISLSAR